MTLRPLMLEDSLPSLSYFTDAAAHRILGAESEGLLEPHGAPVAPVPWSCGGSKHQGERPSFGRVLSPG